MKWRLSLLCTCLALFVCLPEAYGQVPVVGGDGVTLKDLVGSNTLVTIRLKGGGARDMNLKIGALHSSHLSVTDLDGTVTAYNLDQIYEIRVQKGRITRERRPGPGSGVLSSRDLDIEERAMERAYEIFSGNKGNQLMGLRAAALLGAQGNSAAIEDYLRPRATSSDLETAVLASKYLYLAGETPDPEVISRGFQAANRSTLAAAAGLAGWTKYADAKRAVRLLLNDSITEIFSNAARASGRLGDREAIPTLISAIPSLDKEKAEAAVFALSLLGGETVREEMQTLVDRGRGPKRFRAIRVLVAMGDKRMLEELRPENLREPIYAVEAAIILVRGGDWDATLELRDRFEKSSKTTEEALNERARIAAGLIEGGYKQAKSGLQDLLQLTPPDIFLSRNTRNLQGAKKDIIRATQITVCNLIADSGARSLMSILKPTLENQDTEVALAACEAAIAIANPTYRERLVQIHN